jgi:hypothetical protein
MHCQQHSQQYEAYLKTRSIPAINAIPSSGRPIELKVDNTTTSEAPDTPAIPLEVNINTNKRVSCCPTDKMRTL